MPVRMFTSNFSSLNISFFFKFDTNQVKKD